MPPAGSSPRRGEREGGGIRIGPQRRLPSPVQALFSAALFSAALFSAALPSVRPSNQWAQPPRSPSQPAGLPSGHWLSLHGPSRLFPHWVSRLSSIGQRAIAAPGRGLPQRRTGLPGEGRSRPAAGSPACSRPAAGRNRCSRTARLPLAWYTAGKKGSPPPPPDNPTEKAGRVPHPCHTMEQGAAVCPPGGRDRAAAGLGSRKPAGSPSMRAARISGVLPPAPREAAFPAMPVVWRTEPPGAPLQNAI